MAEEERPKRVDIGFSGGQVLSLRIPDAAYHSLSDEVRSGSQGWHQLEAGGERWYSLTSEDSDVLIDIAQVVYVRLDTEQRGVGFSGPP